MNPGVTFNNYKKYARGNWNQSKDRSDIFEADTNNVNAKRNYDIILDSDYNSNHT